MSSAPGSFSVSQPYDCTSVGSKEIACVAGSGVAHGCFLLSFGSGCCHAINTHSMRVSDIRGLHSVNNCFDRRKGHVAN